MNDYFSELSEAFKRMGKREAAFEQFGLYYEDDGETVVISDTRAVNDDEEQGHKIVSEMPSVFGNILADALATYQKPTPDEVVLFRKELGLTD